MTGAVHVLPTVQPVSSVEAAARVLRDAIATGQLGPGARIKEIPVATQLGLSRGSVREALRQLAEEGLVEIVANQGATVVELHATDFLELYALRFALGTLALRRLCGGDHDLGEAASEVARLAEMVRRGLPAEAVDADLSFQDALVSAARLPRTAKVFERTTVQLRACVALVHVDYGPVLEDIRREDAELLALVQRRDRSGAVRLWSAKLDHWVRDFVDHLDEPFDLEQWRELHGTAVE